MRLGVEEFRLHRYVLRQDLYPQEQLVQGPARGSPPAMVVVVALMDWHWRPGQNLERGGQEKTLSKKPAFAWVSHIPLCYLL